MSQSQTIPWKTGTDIVTTSVDYCQAENCWSYSILNLLEEANRDTRETQHQPHRCSLMVGTLVSESKWAITAAKSHWAQTSIHAIAP